MSNTEAIAFLSYSREDDEKARGGIVALARLICDEYSLLTGEDLELFVDKDTKWGEHWRQRIDSALVATTFLIPVLTPRYFRREECLRELFEFAGRAKGLGVDDLICPILYVPVNGLEMQSDDAAKKLIATAQYKDWTELRRRGPEESEHVEAVHGLAERLDEVAKRVAEKQTAREAEEVSGDEVTATVAESVAELRQLLEAWQVLMVEDALQDEKFHGADAVLEKQRAKASTGPSGARFMVAMRQVQEYQPLLERAAQLGEQALQLATQMAPHLTRLLEVVKEHPEERPVIDEIRTELLNSADAYIKRDMGPTIRISTWARQHSHEARGMLQLAQIVEQDERVRRQANAQFQSWLDAQAAVGKALSPAGEADVAESAEGQIRTSAALRCPDGPSVPVVGGG